MESFLAAMVGVDGVKGTYDKNTEFFKRLGPLAIKQLTWIANLGLPIIDVGSGRGEILYWMKKEFPQSSVIGVDPDPNSFKVGKYDRVLMPPSYKTIEDLVQARPGIVGNCVVMIVRPLPEMQHKDSTKPYDYETFTVLKPKVALFMYRADGSDGSSKFHKLMKLYDCPNDQLVRAQEQQHTKRLDLVDFLPYKALWCKYTQRSPAPEMITIFSCSMLVDKTLDIPLPQIQTGETNPMAPSADETICLFIQSMMLYMSTCFK